MWGALGEFFQAKARADVAAEAAQVGGQGVGDGLRPALGYGPPAGVGRRAEHNADGGGKGPVEVLDAVGSDAREQRPGVIVFWKSAGNAPGRLL